MLAFHDFEMVAQGPTSCNLEVVSNSIIRDAEVASWLTSPNQYLQAGQEYIVLFMEGENHTVGFSRSTARGQSCKLASKRALAT
jgi:hypothetical protein